jgi:uncharacterized protein YdeI (YjbR/CyaY-like superfamily)
VGRFLKFIHSKEKLLVIIALSLRQDLRVLRINKKNIVILTKYKVHTKKPTFSHQDAMKEAICFGWIDATSKRINDNVWGVTFRKRGKNARWSNNTLKYAKQMIEQGKMTEAGMKAYELGKSKPTIDHNIPKDAPPPKDLLQALSKNKTALNNFQNLSRTYKHMYIVWVERAKLPETRKRRIKSVVERMKQGNTKWDGKN